MDYADHQRSNNIELAKNVKLVDPNTTVIYSCPVQMDEKEEMSFVFVAPKTIDVREGDILCSPQAGGIMHRIIKTVPDGKVLVFYCKHFCFLRSNDSCSSGTSDV